MLVGVPKEIKVHEYRVGLTPSSVREMTMHNHAVLVQTDAGAGIGATDDDYRRAGARDRRKRRRSIQARGDDRQGQGAAGDRARDVARRPDSVHVSASGARSGAGGRSVEERRDLHRLRDRHCAHRWIAAAGADVRSGRPLVGAGRRALSREIRRRYGHVARRSCRGATGPHRDSRCRHGGNQRGTNGRRHRRRSRRHRHLDRRFAPHRFDARRARDDDIFESRQRRARSVARRSGDLRRSDSGGRGTEARDAQQCCRR